MKELGCLCRLSLHFPVISLVNLSREKKGEIDYMSLHAYMKTARQGEGGYSHRETKRFAEPGRCTERNLLMILDTVFWRKTDEMRNKTTKRSDFRG